MMSDTERDQAVRNVLAIVDKYLPPYVRGKIQDAAKGESNRYIRSLFEAAEHATGHLLIMATKLVGDMVIIVLDELFGDHDWPVHLMADKLEFVDERPDAPQE